jgi:hypothetical protein
LFCAANPRAALARVEETSSRPINLSNRGLGRHRRRDGRITDMEEAMLVLSRKVGEEVIVGPDVRIKVLRIDGRSIRVGITAPRQVLIAAAGTGAVCAAALHSEQSRQRTAEAPPPAAVALLPAALPAT